MKYLFTIFTLSSIAILSGNGSNSIGCLAFLPRPIPHNGNRATDTHRIDSFLFKQHSRSSVLFESNKIVTDSVIATKSSVLDDSLDLTEQERSIINAVRLCGPSVVSVSSSVLPKKSRRTLSRRSKSRSKNNANRGTSLGSGSGFCVSSEGYFITNYHVIERAYSIQSSQANLRQFLTNITQPVLKSPILTNNKNSILSDPAAILNLPEAQVYLGLSPTGSSSSSQPQQCRIVAVRPDVDIAVLHLSSNSTIPKSIPYGLSSDLLVGQTLLAIGNPFGLTQTITTGIVSALDRTFSGVAGKDIRGCIQTDAAINPGNSGGPLLDVKGRVVGVNTAIVSPSGANAGIGFAIGMDDSLRKDIERIIENDREKIDSRRKKKGYLGASVVEESGLIEALRKKMHFIDGNSGGVFVMNVKAGSPAEKAGMVPLKLSESDASVQIGDRIVALGGNNINDPSALVTEIKSRVEGEQISITVEDQSGIRRVLYVTLGNK